MLTTCDVDCPANNVALAAVPEKAVELMVALTIVLPIKMFAELIVTFEKLELITATFDVEICTFEPTLTCGVITIGVVTLPPTMFVLTELLPIAIVVLVHTTWLDLHKPSAKILRKWDVVLVVPNLIRPNLGNDQYHAQHGQ